MDLKTKHLWMVLRLLKKANLLDDLREVFINGSKVQEGQDIEAKQTEMGVDLLIAIASGMELVETEVYELLADLKGITASEVEEQSMEQTISDIKEIMESKSVKGFLTSTVA